MTVVSGLAGRIAARLDAADFPASYKARMIAAYPVIADLSADEAYWASVEEREEAFERILAARNLRRTHELFLADAALGVEQGVAR